MFILLVLGLDLNKICTPVLCRSVVLQSLHIVNSNL